MKILIVGATGTIGKEIAHQATTKGHEVISASRNSEPPLNIEDPSSIEDFFGQMEAVDVIICAAGAASFGRLANQSLDDIMVGINSKLLGQVNLVRMGLDKLKPHGKILLTGGMLAHSPWPETSNVAMVNAGLEGFVKGVALELEKGQKIAIVHPPLIKETAEMMGMDTSPWPYASQVAESYIKALSTDLEKNVLYVSSFQPDELVG